jgi:hypothetical protein
MLDPAARLDSVTMERWQHGKPGVAARAEIDE